MFGDKARRKMFQVELKICWALGFQMAFFISDWLAFKGHRQSILYILDVYPDK